MKPSSSHPDSERLPVELLVTASEKLDVKCLANKCKNLEKYTHRTDFPFNTILVSGILHSYFDSKSIIIIRIT